MQTQSHIVSDVSTTSFFLGFIDSYAPMVRDLDPVWAPVVDEWRAEQHRSIKEGRFFASLNFHAHLVTAG